ncbi:MAG TPA: hypothetical protein VGM87_04865 [Roseomonas sp.]|jgi:hypothetical protein
MRPLIHALLPLGLALGACVSEPPRGMAAGPAVGAPAPQTAHRRPRRVAHPVQVAAAAPVLSDAGTGESASETGSAGDSVAAAERVAATPAAAEPATDPMLEAAITAMPDAPPAPVVLAEVPPRLAAPIVLASMTAPDEPARIPDETAPPPRAAEPAGLLLVSGAVMPRVATATAGATPAEPGPDSGDLLRPILLALLGVVGAAGGGFWWSRRAARIRS